MPVGGIASPDQASTFVRQGVGLTRELDTVRGRGSFRALREAAGLAIVLVVNAPLPIVDEQVRC